MIYLKFTREMIFQDKERKAAGLIAVRSAGRELKDNDMASMLEVWVKAMREIC